jgi:hypothetical protein
VGLVEVRHGHGLETQLLAIGDAKMGGIREIMNVAGKHKMAIEQAVAPENTWARILVLYTVMPACMGASRVE